MPFYEYQCDACGHRFEVMQRISAPPVLRCEECGKAVRRVLFPSTIVYKGSGFYSTEYGRSRFNNPEKRDESSKKDEPVKKDETAKKDDAPKKDAPAAAGTGESKTASADAAPKSTPPVSTPSSEGKKKKSAAAA